MDNFNITVPELPESVNNAIIIQWYKKPGETIKIDDILLELETDKVVLEIPATINGILKKILVKAGEKVQSQQIIGILQKKNILKEQNNNKKNKISNLLFKSNSYNNKIKLSNKFNNLSPSIRKKIKTNNISLNKINDLDDKLILNNKKINNNKLNQKISLNKNNFKKIKMSPIRKYISQKLMDSKNNTVMLTTFNEVNMKKIINIKNDYNHLVNEVYNIKLGFTSFHVKAVTQALQFFKKINAFIEGENIIYNNFYNINIAISTKRGLITPIIYNTDKLSLIDIEKKIKSLVIQSHKNQLSIKDLSSGTFTITNGGVFGSLMSTPIINPPQSAILGIHAIKDRPIVINNKICIMPMMYLALSYDHRLIDGKDAIGFLMLIKRLLEDPIRLFLQI
ncbi:dihydrolipoyllysine-residue succinyltransferase [Enterobacteriaceae endosymbiont of Donacia versicolorea]|uniref:dihydrolipoyllysine-residue succinyltransferase n=1 Tax=Enterobacteriaceae endosymbiont of Donacia versicolorea TaxID=2675788 RepID=UPI001448C1EE|nr:dihydrolipoyllysine-residue succinyltransferase [Enterobacteriaceae endosymbiont of Donacia versicolorea]QJC32067.1 dihydrolipoyllysine-residue succinyltransferase [Enterobacteriaceae endosymbiont of Donacia versicolorea]